MHLGIYYSIVSISVHILMILSQLELDLVSTTIRGIEMVQLSRNRFFKIALYGLPAAFLTGISDAITINNIIEFEMLSLPSVLIVMSATCLIAWMLFMPFSYWALKHARLSIAVPILYAWGISIPAFLNLVVKNAGVTQLGELIGWFVALLLIKILNYRNIWAIGLFNGEPASKDG